MTSFKKMNPSIAMDDPHHLTTFGPGWKSLAALWSRGTRFLGCDYAILGGAMSWVSNHILVASISQAGGFGVLAGGALPPEVLDEELTKTQALTNRPFGVNLITFHPQLEKLMEVCLSHKVKHIFLGGGIPSGTSIEHLKKAGRHVIGFAPSPILAKRLIRLGIDALVVEGHEAGGHIGPVATQVLAQEILPLCPPDIPVFVAGGIGHGRAIASYLFMGASGCQLGTRFVCAEESCAHPAFKQAFIKASARDAVVSVQVDPLFPIIPVRALENKGTQEFINAQKEAITAYQRGDLDKKQAQLKIELFWAGALKRAVIEGDIEYGSLMAGQSVGMVNEIEPCAKIIHHLIKESCDHLHASPLLCSTS